MVLFRGQARKYKQRTTAWSSFLSSHIFDYIDGDTSTREYAIKCSFLEIYKEVVRDLLNPKNVDMKIRESPQKGVWVDGLTEEVLVCWAYSYLILQQFVTSEQDIADLITIGDNAKAVSATQMNARSSRSHRYGEGE